MLTRLSPVLWPIVAAPLSAQFTYDGHVIFITRNGVVYVLRRGDGTQVLDPFETVPGLEPGNASGCLRGGPDSGCASANT